MLKRIPITALVILLAFLSILMFYGSMSVPPLPGMKIDGLALLMQWNGFWLAISVVYLVVWERKKI